MYSEVSANTRDYTKKVRTKIEVRGFRHSESLHICRFQNTVAENNMFFKYFQYREEFIIE